MAALFAAVQHYENQPSRNPHVFRKSLASESHGANFARSYCAGGASRFQCPWANFHEFAFWQSTIRASLAGWLGHASILPRRLIIDPLHGSSKTIFILGSAFCNSLTPCCVTRVPLRLTQVIVEGIAGEF